MAEKKDTSKPIIAAILNLVIPGLGHWFIKSKYALQYFGGWVAAYVVAFILSLVTLGMCFPIWIVVPAWAIVSAIDVYYEAISEPEKRLLKQYVK